MRNVEMPMAWPCITAPSPARQTHCVIEPRHALWRDRPRDQQAAGTAHAYRLHRPESLRALVRDMVTKAGWTDAEAQETADHLVLANLSGHDSHGVGMIPLYFQSLADGNLSPQSQPPTRARQRALPDHRRRGRSRPARLRAMPSTTRPRWRKTAASPSSICSDRASYRPHRPLCRGRRGSRADLVLLGECRRPPADRRALCRQGSAFRHQSARASAFPCLTASRIILDFATSRMAHGKARVALNKGEQVPPGYIIDGEGRPTTDPGACLRQPGPCRSAPCCPSATTRAPASR